MEIIEKRLSQLKPYKKNPRQNKDAVPYVARSIKEFGFKVPIVIDKKGEIVAGHTRYLASKELGLETVPCIVADDLTKEQIKAFRLADNKVAEKSKWDEGLLELELDEILDLDMTQFGFEVPDIDLSLDLDDDIDDRRSSLQHNVFENQERMQFETDNFWGIPNMKPTQTVGDKWLRFCDWKEIDNPSEYIAHFYYDDYKFMSAWREPDKYIERLKQFKAVISPDFSLYTDFPRSLQLLSCYRRQWCGAYWQSLGIDVIPDVVWGDEDSFDYCFLGIPKGSVVAVSSVGVRNDETWNNKESDLFKRGYDEMMKRLEPTVVLYYGSMIEGLEGDIIRIPTYYELKRGEMNGTR